MTKKSIFRPLMAAIMVTLAPFSVLRGDVTVMGHVRLRTERSGGADYVTLRLAARRIELLLRRGKNKLPDGRTLLILSDARQFRLTRSKREWTLHLPGSSKMWKRDFQLRRRLYGALLAARLEITPSNDTPQISEWLTAAIDRSITNSHRSELYVAGNGTYAQSAHFFRRYGKLPDFASLSAMQWELLPTPARAAADEFALLLAEILARRQSLIAQIDSDLHGGTPDAWAKCFISGADARQRSIEKDAWTLVWTRRQPLPPEFAEQRIAAITGFNVPEINSKGEPTGKWRTLTPAETARELAHSGRSDAASLRRSLAVPWNEFARECDPESQNLCRKIAAAITLFGIDGKAPEDFSAALDKLKKRTARRRKLEQFLDRTERKYLPIPYVFGAGLEAVDSGNPALTTPDKIFLLLAERDYLDE